MNSNPRTLPAVLLLITGLILVAGCGDTFRPTITPVVKPGGDPSNLGQAVVLSTNPSGNGSNMHIDTSGDTNVGVVSVGPNPTFLAKGGSRLLVVNGDNTVTLYIALLPTSSTITTSVLPATTTGQVAAGVGVNGNLYIANSTSNDVSVIPIVGTVANAAVPVGTQPVSIAGSIGTTGVGATKMYAVNGGSNNVTVFSAVDNSFIKNIAVGSQPIWAVMSTDTGAVYVVNQGDGTVSVIDTGIDSVITTIPVGASPNFAYFDSNLKRVYVTNTGSSTLSVIKGDTINLGAGIVPTKIADVALSGPAVSVVALSDGTRAYAALGGCPSGTNHTNIVGSLASCTGNRVSVIDAVALRETQTIAVGSGAVSVDAANDASRVYSVNANDRSVSIIRTSTNSELMRTPAPQRDFTCTGSCPLQTPFMVRVFP
ncbi:MAG TPA: YncE family protein [Candidatus Angelobacter sp.]|jgi:YVTN family beta-propeller protein|nr:YncE family protein [Candidatus Angelobacter sp.]